MKTGSFGTSKETIEARIRADKAADQMADAVGAADKAVEAEVEAKKEDKVDQYLPEKVYSLSRQREYEYEEFKGLYTDVWAAVASKDHLMKGTVTITATIGGSEVTMRSLSAREAQGLATWENGATSGKSQEKNEYLIRRLIVQIQAINDQPFKRSVKLTPDTVEEWVKSSEVKQAYDFFVDKDLVLILLLIDALNDLDMAKQLALTENLRHP